MVSEKLDSPHHAGDDGDGDDGDDDDYDDVLHYVHHYDPAATRMWHTNQLLFSKSLKLNNSYKQL